MIYTQTLECILGIYMGTFMFGVVLACCAVRYGVAANIYSAMWWSNGLLYWVRENQNNQCCVL